MAQRPNPPDRDGQTGPGRTDDPMSADRRVLAVAAASMVALVLVGVVSAQVFTRSACTRIDPSPVDARGVAGGDDASAVEADTDVPTVLHEAFPALDDAGHGELIEALGVLDEVVGPLLRVADVTGAERLAAVDGGVAALGTVTTALSDDADRAPGAADLDEATVVGSGPALYSLALVNQLTGQVDAMQPLDLALTAGTCVDTATVGTPLAFHLDAGEGQLLLFRTEEDGDEPAIELRDGTVGSRWSTELEVGTAPAGVLAERVTARLGEAMVVAGWRTTAGDDGAAVAGLDRETGEVAWTVEAPELRELLPIGDAPLWIEVVTVTDDEVVLSLIAEEGPDDERLQSMTAVLDVDDGTLRWSAETMLPLTVAAVPADGGWFVLSAQHGQLGLTDLEADTGQVRGHLSSQATGEARAARLPDGSVAAVGRGGLIVADDASRAGARTDATGLYFGVWATDVLVVDDRFHLLLTTDEGAAVATFAITPADD